MAGVEEGRKRSGVDGVRQVRGMQAGGGADQITSPGTLQAFVRILAFTLIEMGSSVGLEQRSDAVSLQSGRFSLYF